MKTLQCSCGAPKDKRSKTCRKCHDQFEVVERICTRCRKPKPVSEFRIRTRITPRPRSWCRKCEAEVQSGYIKTKFPNSTDRIQKLREWERQNPDKVQLAKRTAAIRKLGLEDETPKILERLEKQLFCEICQQPPMGRYKRLHLDHDHTSGRFRGLLCDRCNLSIGKFNDDPELLRAAAKYLDASIDSWLEV